MNVHASLLAAAALFAIPAAALAGDCASHPTNVIELEVATCSAVDATTIVKVSRWLAGGDDRAKAALPGLVSEHRNMVVVEGTVKRTTQIHRDRTSPPRARDSRRGPSCSSSGRRIAPATPVRSSGAGAGSTAIGR